MVSCDIILRRLTRRKYIDWQNLDKSNLARRLTWIDLVALGIGSTLGAGAYVIAGQVAREKAGPAGCISFFLAAVASVLAGLCYAEFGARVPKTGSAYTFTYVTVGEFLAFVIGWNLLLEYVIGSASVARTASNYLDELVDGVVEDRFNRTFPMSVPSLAPYADPLALGIVVIITIILIVGVKESSLFNNIFTVLNLTVLTFIIVAGFWHDDIKNWRIPAEDVNGTTCTSDGDPCGSGGFAPYGFDGIVKGAATAFYAFVGFDAIATTGEEVKNPQRAIPLSISISLAVIFVMYFLISLTVTMLGPYYTLDTDAPLAVLFENVGWNWAKYVVGIGALCALTTSLLGGMFPMPRVVLAMARDGVLFRFFAYVSPSRQTPLPATIIMGALTGIMAMLFDVDALVNMMSIGTLLAYTLVSFSVLLLRYEASFEEKIVMQQRKASTTPQQFAYQFQTQQRGVWDQIIHPNSKSPTEFSAKIAKILAIISAGGIITFSTILAFATSEAFKKHLWWALLILIIGMLVTAITLILIVLQPESQKKISFKVPGVPFFPAASMFCNIYLMLQLDYLTWIRFGVWLAIGFAIYFCYGQFHSDEELRDKGLLNEDPKPQDGQKFSSVTIPIDEKRFGMDEKRFGMDENQNGMDENRIRIESPNEFEKINGANGINGPNQFEKINGANGINGPNEFEKKNGANGINGPNQFEKINGAMDQNENFMSMRF